MISVQSKRENRGETWELGCKRCLRRKIRKLCIFKVGDVILSRVSSYGYVLLLMPGYGYRRLTPVDLARRDL